jgi:hypothetical protein
VKLPLEITAQSSGANLLTPATSCNGKKVLVTKDFMRRYQLISKLEKKVSTELFVFTLDFSP